MSTTPMTDLIIQQSKMMLQMHRDALSEYQGQDLELLSPEDWRDIESLRNGIAVQHQFQRQFAAGDLGSMVQYWIKELVDQVLEAESAGDVACQQQDPVKICG